MTRRLGNVSSQDNALQSGAVAHGADVAPLPTCSEEGSRSRPLLRRRPSRPQRPPPPASCPADAAASGRAVRRGRPPPPPPGRCPPARGPEQWLVTRKLSRSRRRAPLRPAPSIPAALALAAPPHPAGIFNPAVILLYPAVILCYPAASISSCGYFILPCGYFGHRRLLLVAPPYRVYEEMPHTPCRDISPPISRKQQGLLSRPYVSMTGKPLD